MSAQGPGAAPAPLRRETTRPRWSLPAALSRLKPAKPWSDLLSWEVLQLLPTTSKGPLALIKQKRVVVTGIEGDVGFGRILWSRERVELTRLHSESQQRRAVFHSTIHSQLHVRHQNLHCIRGTCDFGADILIVRPRIDGWPLRSYLKEKRSADRRAIILDIAQGLRYLHSQDIVHGDVSMGNVMVVRDGQYALTATNFQAHPTPDPGVTESEASWTEFQWDSDGSSSSESDPELDTVVPGRGERLFAVSPEGHVEPATAAGARAFLYSTDKRGDIFAFGHLIVEIFTEVSPYQSPSALEILRRTATHRRPRHPGSFALTRGLDKRLWRICKRCWNVAATSPNSYTAQEVADALARPRNDVIICPFEWSEDELRSFVWKHVRNFAKGEITDLEQVVTGKDAEDGKYELRATCHQWYVRAVKVIPHWAHRRYDLRQIIHPELFVWCQLQHAHIAPLLGVFRNQFDNTTCFVVPWMAGGTCLDYIREHPNTDRLSIAVQVADALAYLHSRAPPVVHARVQAHSVWMTENGTAYLSNFDFQPQLHPDKGFDDSDRKGIFWAQKWAALEVGQTVDTRRDVFAFAMFMYEIYAGHPPFHRKDMVDTFWAYREGRRPARPDHGQLTDDIWGLIQKCWRVAPYRRPTMKAVFRRLCDLARDPETGESAR